MSDDAAGPTVEPVSHQGMEPSFPVAGLGRRFLAYLIDVIPIMLLVAAVFYVFLGFDETLRQYTNRDPDDLDARVQFLVERNRIRDLSMLIYILYAAILEGTVLQGTFGKRLMGVRVTDNQGRALSVARSFGRNFAKIISWIPCFFGFLWAIWSKNHRAWHDMIAKTLVVERSAE